MPNLQGSKRAVGLGMLVLLLASPAWAQTLPPVPPADYGRWERLYVSDSAESTPLSPDGRWLAYRILRSNGESELRIAVTRGAGGNDTRNQSIPFGEHPVFSADSAWVAYAIGLPEAERERLEKDKKPVRLKLGLMNLASGQSSTVEEVQSFGFDGTGRYLAMARYAPEAPKQEAPDSKAAAKESDPIGTSLIVRTLQSGAETAFGNVTAFGWSDQRALLAFTVGSKDRIGNAIQLYDAASSQLRVLDSGKALYSGLAWRKDADDLVVLRSSSRDDRDGPAQTALAWSGVAKRAIRREFDPLKSQSLPADRRIVSFRAPQFSKDGSRVYLGVAAWRKKEAAPAADPPATDKSAADNSATAKSATAKSATAESATDSLATDKPEVANVDIWHWRDVQVMPLQNHDLKEERERNVLAAWDLAKGKLLELASDPRDVIQLPSGSGEMALVQEQARYGMDRSIGRLRADLAVVNLTTGARQPVGAVIVDDYAWIGPDGRYVLYLLDNHYWSYEIATGKRRKLTDGVTSSFVDLQSDLTRDQKPIYGMAAWTSDGSSVLVYDRYDIWELSLAGKQPKRLTSGAAQQIVHRVLRLDKEPDIDRSRPLYLSLFGEWTKRSGFASLSLRTSQVRQLVYRDQRIDSLAKAKSADVYAYVAQSFQESPDYYVDGAGLAAAQRVTHTNPFQRQYAWGRAELIEYRSTSGERLQGVLQYPADYDPAKRYPMVVYMYERLSDELHRYSAPSERLPYNASVLNSQGYFMFQPDIAFRPREPGLSVVECVVPAVQAALAHAAIDPKRVGIMGHSWGGFDTAYLATHTNTFAAAVAGAPITNLVSNYGSHHWSNGIAETDHIETGQQRMQVPLWEDLPAYIRNSAVFNVHQMTTPLLLAFGQDDGTVHWYQGVEMYNIARRAGKPVVMLAYPGEDHGLQKRAVRMDYQRRMLQWFGHYLKGEAAAAWITDGMSALEKERQAAR